MKLNCPHCQYLLKVPDNAAGRTGTCPKCGHKVRVPSPEPQVRYYRANDLELEPEPEPVPRRNRVWPDETAPAPRPRGPHRTASAPAVPSSSRTGGGFGTVLKVGCFFIVLAFVALTLIGALAGRQNRDRESPMQSAASRSEHWVDSLDEYGDWETPIELEDSDPESRAAGHFAIAQLLSRGTSLGGGLVMFEDGRIFNRDTFKVKCKRY